MNEEKPNTDESEGVPILEIPCGSIITAKRDTKLVVRPYLDSNVMNSLHFKKGHSTVVIGNEIDKRNRQWLTVMHNSQNFR